MQNKVFAVIVTYNGALWIDKCLQSLRDSSLPLSIIVVDNDSQDDTPARVKASFIEADLVQSTRNLGFGQANNIGIKRAYDLGADHVFLLNQDTWIEKDTIKTLVDAANKYPEYGVISPIHLNGRGNGLDRNFSIFISPQWCPQIYSDKWCDALKQDLYPVDFVNAAAWLLSRTCIATVGGFNPAFFHYGEDDNYLHRVHYHGLKVGICALANIFHDRETFQPLRGIWQGMDNEACDNPC